MILWVLLKCTPNAEHIETTAKHRHSALSIHTEHTDTLGDN